MENNNKNKGPNKNRQGWGIICSLPCWLLLLLWAYIL